jgi:Ca2+-binding RTX toxin-like protein
VDAELDLTAGTINPSNPKPLSAIIYGAHNAAIIRLGAGDDTVTLGDAQNTVFGGTGNDTFKVDKNTVGATINGGGGLDTLSMTGGGTFAMGSNITDVDKVVLASSTTAYDVTANGIDGLGVTGTSAADTLRAGGLNQILTGGAGLDTLVGFSGGNTTFKDTSANLNGDTVGNFAALGDKLHLTDMLFANTPTVSFTPNGGGTAGTLAISDGIHSASITLLGQFIGSFEAASDGGVGTIVTFEEDLVA